MQLAVPLWTGGVGRGLNFNLKLDSFFRRDASHEDISSLFHQLSLIISMNWSPCLKCDGATCCGWHVFKEIRCIVWCGIYLHVITD